MSLKGSVALILLAPDPAMSPAKASALSAGTRRGLHFGGREHLVQELTANGRGASVVLQLGSDKNSRFVISDGLPVPRWSDTRSIFSHPFSYAPRLNVLFLRVCPITNHLPTQA